MLAQMFLFVAWDYLTSTENNVWLSLSKAGTLIHVYIFYCSNKKMFRDHLMQYPLMFINNTHRIYQVFQITYCQYFDPRTIVEARKICTQPLCASVKRLNPDFLQKPKFHIRLHLPENMAQFGPTASFNSEG